MLLAIPVGAGFAARDFERYEATLSGGPEHAQVDVVVVSRAGIALRVDGADRGSDEGGTQRREAPVPRGGHGA
jgi:hypothetical protein